MTPSLLSSDPSSQSPAYSLVIVYYFPVATTYLRIVHHSVLYLLGPVLLPLGEFKLYNQEHLNEQILN